MAVVKSRKKAYIHIVIIIAFMTLFGALPPVGPLTPIGMHVLGIFIGMIYGWSIGEQAWPSLLGLVMLGLLEGNTVTGVLSEAFSNATLQLILYSLLFCYGISSTGLLEYTAKFILSRKFAKKGPWWLCFAFWLAAAVAGAITTNSLAVTILLWSIFYPIAEELKLPKKSPYVAIMLIGICVTSYTGGTVFPYSAFVNVGFGILRSAYPDVQISYAAYILDLSIYLKFHLKSVNLIFQF